MKLGACILLTISILFLTVQLVQAVDQNFTSLKIDYIKSHPNQAIIPFPWEPSTSIRVLPFNYAIPASPSNNLSITACRNEFKSASFIVTAQKELSGITIISSDLHDSQGNSIPADAINIRTVKVWYQAANNQIWYSTTPGNYLAPELLLKDDSLVKVDYVNKINYLKVIVNGSEQYIDVSKHDATFPSNAQIYDTPSLQPFSLKANENKQIWLTIHIPNNTPAGEYTGDITITPFSETPVNMTLTLKVMPFDLEPAPVEYSLYYYGVLPAYPAEEALVGINSEMKTPLQYSRELQNMKDHGILYPTVDQPFNSQLRYIQTLNLSLSLRSQTGLPMNRIYVLGLETGNSTNSTVLTNLKQAIIQYKNISAQYGCQEIYIYGIDEASDEELRSERTAWQTVHSAGAKVFASVSDNTKAVNIVGDTLDVAVFADALNTTHAAQWHTFGKKIFSYANPEAGVEDPAIYRKNYGFALWNAGYDGAMVFAYQEKSGQNIWNDFDNPSTKSWVPRDCVFAYPTSNGVIDTIQWEGWREGVDDTRYLATLIKHEGSNTSSRTFIADSLAKNEDMATIRGKIIDRILISLTPTPTPTQIRPTISDLTTFENITLELFYKGIFTSINSLFRSL